MQPSQPSHRRGRSERGVRRPGVAARVTLIAVGFLLAGLVGMTGLGAVRALAQDEATFEGVTIEVFGSGAPAAAPENQLTLRRVTFAPGGGVPPHSHPGAVTFSVASGELAYTLIEGEASVQRAAVDGAPGPIQAMLVGALTQLVAGDSVFLDGTIGQAANLGDEPAVLWVSSLLAADQPFLTVIEPPEGADAAEPTVAADEATEPEDAEPEATQAAAVEGVRVTLDEFTIRLSSEIPAGETTFVITNAGSIYHSFAIVGDGVEAALEAPLKPGETVELTVDLPSGTYQIVCPVANHEALGMTRDLVVV